MNTKWLGKFICPLEFISPTGLKCLPFTLFTEGPGHSVHVTVKTARAVLYFDIKLRQGLDPFSQNSFGSLERFQPLQTVVVCSQGADSAGNVEEC